MSYTIAVRVYQTNVEAFFHVVEKTVWHYANGGTWHEFQGEHILTMGGSGTSGTLRFDSDTGESFLVALGVHNYKRWCDIVTGLNPGETGVVIHREYYHGSERDNGLSRGYVREGQWASYEVQSLGDQQRKFEVVYSVAQGRNLRANVIIH